jgi:hypothetical protein
MIPRYARNYWDGYRLTWRPRTTGSTIRDTRPAECPIRISPARTLLLSNSCDPVCGLTENSGLELRGDDYPQPVTREKPVGRHQPVHPEPHGFPGRTMPTIAAG